MISPSDDVFYLVYQLNGRGGSHMNHEIAVCESVNHAKHIAETVKTLPGYRRAPRLLLTKQDLSKPKSGFAILKYPVNPTAEAVLRDYEMRFPFGDTEYLGKPITVDDAAV